MKIHEVLCICRLLGSLSVNLQEVVSRHSQNVSSPLKSKKGEIMQVNGGRDGREEHSVGCEVVLCGRTVACMGLPYNYNVGVVNPCH